MEFGGSDSNQTFGVAEALEQGRKTVLQPSIKKSEGISQKKARPNTLRTKNQNEIKSDAEIKLDEIEDMFAEPEVQQEINLHRT